MKSKGGRPTTYTDKLAERIIERIMSGESVADIVKDPAMPANSTLYKWLAEKRTFSESYAHALEFRTHLKAEQRHSILEDAMLELAQGNMPEGFNFNVWGNLVKEKIRAIEWDAERLAPRKYKVNHQEPEKPSDSNITINFVPATKPDAD